MRSSSVWSVLNLIPLNRDIFLYYKMKLQLIFAVLCLSYASCYKILILLPFTGPSHFLMFKVFMKELLNRGHEITAISAFPYNGENSNYTEILIDPQWSPGSEFTQEMIFDMQFGNQIQMLLMYWWIGINSTQHCLEIPAVKDFIRNDDTKFDLIISEQFFQEALLMFSHKYQAPIITLSTYGYSDFFDRIMGSITPYAFVPHMILANYDDNMSFLQRTHNFVFSLADILIREFYYLPAMNSMAHKYFSHLSDLPSIRDLEKSISVILVNSHVALFKPRPNMPGVIEIAGSHIEKLKPLPKEIQTFLDDAEHGAIYMSLGSYVQSSNMPKEKLKIILRVFGSLKQRVLWKYEKENLEDLPSNIMIGKWMPQAEILNHSKVILFISHGGLFGTMEGSYFGVPILFFPFFGDQYRNAKMVEKQGYGQHLVFTKLNMDSLLSKIEEMIQDKRYLEKAKEISSILQDSPTHPLNTSMYWIEYVARHKGAKHLKSHAINIPFYQYLMLDVIAFIILIAWIVFKTAQVLINKLFTMKARKQKML